MADIVNKVHVSPGIYATETVDMKTAANSVGVTKLAAVGETIKGPAFQPYWIHSPKEYASVFGGTSTEKFKGSNYPKYELPYIANEYLKKGTELCVVRTLGISGYNAGPAWLITGSKAGSSEKYVIAVLRSRGTYKYRPEYQKININGCSCDMSNDAMTFDVGEKATIVSCDAPVSYNMDAVSLSPYTSLLDIGNECTSYELSGNEDDFYVSYGNLGRFTINCIVGPSDKKVDDVDDDSVKHIPVSLNKSDKDYILNVLGSSNSDGDMPLFVETLYDVAWEDLVLNKDYNKINNELYKYDAAFISDYSGLLPVNGILTKYEEELKKSDLGKRYLYATQYGSPLNVTHHEFNYNTGLESSDGDACDEGHIYTVVAIFDDKGKKVYVYRSYSEESTEDLYGDEKVMAQDKLVKNTASESKHGMCVYNAEDGLYYHIGGTIFNMKSEFWVTTRCSYKKANGYDFSSGNVDTYIFKISDKITESDRYTSLYLRFPENHYNRLHMYEVNSGLTQYPTSDVETSYSGDSPTRKMICIGDNMYYLMSINSAATYQFYNKTSSESSTPSSAVTFYTLSSETSVNEELGVGFKINIADKKYVGVNNQLVDVHTNASGDTFYKFEGGQYKYLAIPAGCNNVGCWNLNYSTKYSECTTRYSVVRIDFSRPEYWHKQIDITGQVTLRPDDLSKDYVVCDSQVNPYETGSTYVQYSLYAFEYTTPVLCDLNNYKSQYRYSSTPWVVSNVKGDAKNIELNKLFRFHTISDGAASVNEVKVSIENIRPDSGEFDVIVRSYNDVDASTTVLEAFRRCTMGTGKNSIAYKIGTIDGMYESKSKYITVEVVDSSVAKNSVPAGFMGYPIPRYDQNALTYITDPNVKTVPISYNKNYYEDIPKRKQYFGISDIAGYDYDYFTFKGNMATLEDPGFLTNGFHLDARLDLAQYDTTKESPTITVDGVTGYGFDCVGVNERTPTLDRIPVIASENDMYGSIYEDVKLRKFTMAFAGGFDGWDPYRDQRTNTNEFSQTSYKGYVNKRTGEGRNFSSFDGESYGIEGRALTTDYYATLAGVSMLKNPEEVDVNLLVTPGIDTINNTQLVGEVFNILEDRADTFYVVDTPDKYAGSSDYIEDIPDTEEIVYDFTDREIYSDYAATYYPWVKIEDNGEYVWLPATRDVVRNLTESDNTNTTMNLAPAGTTRGRVDAIRARKNLKNSESDELYEANINPVRTYAQEGLVIMGQKTLRQQDDLMNRVDVRRMVLRLRKLIAIGCLGLIFEPNDNNTVKAFKSIISGIMQTFMDNRAIEKWTMDVDDSAEMRDRLELSAVIYIKPIRALEYITLNFVVTNNDVYFDN